jgi:hypothetical protein
MQAQKYWTYLFTLSGEIACNSDVVLGHSLAQCAMCMVQTHCCVKLAKILAGSILISHCTASLR